jgi:hypothetical protein
MFYWGYRWLMHEMGHTLGLPDLYMYEPVVDGVKVNQFFYVGGWDLMGNIGGHSGDYFAWHKWKLHWIRDDQVDVVSRPSETHHVLSPLETPGGSKMVVVRTSATTAYVAEFRTRLGVNGLDNRGKYAGVLLYRVDASQSTNRGHAPLLQVVSRSYYRQVQLAGIPDAGRLWRPTDGGLGGLDGEDACWQAGDVFIDPATGVTIRIDRIGHNETSSKSSDSYTVDDTAQMTVYLSKH